MRQLQLYLINWKRYRHLSEDMYLWTMSAKDLAIAKICMFYYEIIKIVGHMAGTEKTVKHYKLEC